MELSKLFGEKIINTGKVPLSFFCCLLRREIFDKIGLLDPEFGIGIGDDDDVGNDDNDGNDDNAGNDDNDNDNDDGSHNDNDCGV